jgi:uncharacterized protein (DUF433 family)
VRIAARIASEHFDTEHPFATRRVFTDGEHIFSAVTDDHLRPNVVQWSPGEIEQIAAGGLFAQFLSDIEFDASTSLARRWWPHGRATPVVLDPRVAFGAPVIAGTAVRTAVVAQLARRTSACEAARAYALDPRHVDAALCFETALAAA